MWLRSNVMSMPHTCLTGFAKTGPGLSCTGLFRRWGGRFSLTTPSVLPGFSCQISTTRNPRLWIELLALWLSYFLFFFYLLIWERESNVDFVFSFIYAFIGRLSCASWLEMEPETVVYQEDTVTNWATLPGDSATFKWSLHKNEVG